MTTAPAIDRQLEARTAVITGAGGGVGRSLAVVFAQLGAHVVVASPRENGAETVAMIEAAGGSGEWSRCDATSHADIETAVGAAIARTGRLDAMIHNAMSRHSNKPVRLEDSKSEIFADHVGVSFRGAYFCARAAHPYLRETGGSLLVMTSGAGMEGSSLNPEYTIVKGALRGFAKALAREWGPDAIRVNAVSLIAKSPGVEEYLRLNPHETEAVLGIVPLGRFGDADTDIAPAVAFLVGDGGRYITGQTLIVDGGRYTFA